MDTHALVVGESLVDIVRAPDGSTTERPGGSAANVAVALARLGRPVRLATAYADDERGRVLADRLADEGIELASTPHAVARTSTALATIGADGAAAYEFDLEWRLHEVADAGPRFVHVCSLGAVVAPGADSVLALLERLRGSATISYDVNARPAITGAGPDLVARVERVVSLATVVKVSDEDLAALYPTLRAEDAAEHLRSMGPHAVALTRGDAGSTWYAAGGPVSIAARLVPVVDTIGAGDTFAAAIIDALWDDLDRDPTEVLAHAVRAAAVTVSRAGADPPYQHELR
ncbi:MAG: carbohydrate kinase [Nocardioides sp.]